MNTSWKRQHLRAPVYSKLIFTENSQVRSGICENVSEGGIFFKANSSIKENDVFSLMFLLITYPDLYSKTRQELFSLTRKTLVSSVLRGKVVVRRRVDSVNSKEGPGFGCKFVNITTNENQAINQYVKSYARNIVFILNLFEGMSTNNDNVNLIRSLTRFLGYPIDIKMPFLRQKLLHDYQSLESNLRI